MSKNQINFTKMSQEAMSQLTTFKENALLIAKEDLRFKEAMKPLKVKLEEILSNRENDLAQGLSLEEVCDKFPRIDVDNAIRKLENEHKAIIEPLNKAMRETYAFIPNNMHEAYDRIQMGDYGYGCFISGPSKTADIAQALVLGAQAARGVTVLIR